MKTSKWCFEVITRGYGTFYTKECTREQALSEVARVKAVYAKKRKRPKVTCYPFKPACICENHAVAPHWACPVKEEK